MLPPESLPDVALELLAIWPADAAVAQLAGLPARAPRPAAEAAFDRIGRQRGLPFLQDAAQRERLGRLIARLIARRSLAAAEGAALTRKLANYAPDDGRYLQHPLLLEIASIGALWDEYPDQRSALADEVYELARRIAAEQLRGVL